MRSIADPTGWGSELPPPVAVEMAERWISPRSGLLHSVTRRPKMSDLPPVYQYSAPFTRTDVLGELSLVGESGGGTSFRPVQAKLGAIGEAFERYCEGIYDRRAFVEGSYEELRSTRACLDPGVSARVGFERPADARAARLSWAQAVDLRSREKTWIPAQFVYVPYRFGPDEPTLRGPTSSGSAAGTSTAGALLRAILELIEREAFLLTCLHRHRPRGFDLATLGDPLVASALEWLPFCGFELQVLDLTTDLQVPVALAVLVDRTGRYPALALGAKCALSARDAVVGAIEESFLTQVWSRHLLARRGSEVERLRGARHPIASIEDRVLYWSAVEALEEVPFLVGPRPVVPIPRSEPPGERSTRDRLTRVIEGLGRRGVDLYARELTTEDVAAHGFCVVRVVSPQLVPLYLDENERAWVSARLFEVPARLAWEEAKGTAADLFAAPHPFP